MSFAAATANVSKYLLKNNWPDNAQVANTTAAVGDLVAFLFIKGTALVLLALLEPMQQIKQNQDDPQTLTTTIVPVPDTLHEEVKAQF